MKIETPQILWHNGSEGNGKPAPLYSVSVLPSVAAVAHDTHPNGKNLPLASKNDKDLSENDVDILATAGNSNEIHIWKMKFSPIPTNDDSTTSTGTGSTSTNDNKHKDVKGQKSLEPQVKKTKIFSLSSPLIQHTTTLTRHERSINALSFSPNGNHLASAGDGGALMVHTVPSTHRFQDTTISSHNGSSCPQVFWKHVLQKESDLSVKVLHTAAEDVMDISWSASSDKFIIGTLDHSVIVFQEDFCSTEQVVKSWSCIWKNNKEHTHYVQGVAYDPLGVYLASQGSDRSVRVWQRKYPKTAMMNNGNASFNGNGNASGAGTGGVNEKERGQVGSKKVVEIHDEKNSSMSSSSSATATMRGIVPSSAKVFNPVGVRFDVEKAKILKYRMMEEDGNSSDIGKNDTDAQDKNANAIKKRHLYADESTVESFFRRLSWTADGVFLVTPASVWHESETGGPSFATLLFLRHQFEKPYKVFHGLEKPSVAICANPVLFQVPNTVPPESNRQQVDNDGQISAQDGNVTSEKCQRHDSILPYRSIFAVLTIDSILIYDTYHSVPLCIARNLHYAGLTDCSWSPDGHHLVVSSTDGYISIISFDRGELGDLYVPIQTASAKENESA
jgi:FOG: WD40 repeat